MARVASVVEKKNAVVVGDGSGTHRELVTSISKSETKKLSKSLHSCYSAIF